MPGCSFFKIAFDKTEPLTYGSPQFANVQSLALPFCAACAELKHPLGRSGEEARERSCQALLSGQAAQADPVSLKTGR